MTNACACHETCRVCASGSASRNAITTHNLRAACHGERSYTRGVSVASQGVARALIDTWLQDETPAQYLHRTYGQFAQPA